MSNVGWNEPKAQLDPTIAVDNGDGTGVINNADGTSVPFVTVDTDTTYTLTQAGDVLTFAGSDGSTQTITVVHPDDEDTVLGDPSPDATTGIVTWPVLDADGNPTGDTRTGDFSAFLSSPHPTIAASGDATATYDAGTNTWTIGFVDTNTDQHMTVVTNPDGSQSLQLVDIDGNHVGAPTQLTPPNELYRTTETTADTVANATTANTGKALEVGNLNWLLTNSASESGARGVRNPGGTLGYSSHVVSFDSALNYNGALCLIPATAPAVLSDGRYRGQIVKIFGGSVASVHELVSDKFWGVARDINSSAIKQMYSATGSNSVKLYWQESITLVWLGSLWLIADFNYQQRSGVGWSEGEDGTITGWGNLPYNAAVFPAFTAPFTHIIEDTINGTFVAKGAQY